MKIFLVFAHPLKEGSFNHAMKEIAQEKIDSLKISDLYEMKFKACADWQDFKMGELPSQYTLAQKEAFSHHALAPDIQEEHQKILWCEGIILQFPLWWFGVPAILKGWLDRVLVKGFAYDKGKWFDTGLLRGKRAKLVLTTQSAEASYETGGVHGPIEAYLKPIHHTLALAGFSIHKPFVGYGVDGGAETLRDEVLAKYREEVRFL